MREAVKTLAAKGLLEARPRIGTRVLEPTHWNLLDLDVLGWRYATMPRTQFFRELFEIRRMIEPNAAALAAERATDEEIAALDAAYAAMQATDHASDAAIDADLRFHRAVLDCSHNELLVQMGGRDRGRLAGQLPNLEPFVRTFATEARRGARGDPAARAGRSPHGDGATAQRNARVPGEPSWRGVRASS